MESSVCGFVVFWYILEYISKPAVARRKRTNERIVSILILDLSENW